MTTFAQHERAVAEFMAQARTADRERDAVVESKYPVLTNRQMKSRQVRENSFFQTTLFSDLYGRGAGVLKSAYSRRSRRGDVDSR
jgi:hypothetical protein